MEPCQHLASPPKQFGPHVYHQASVHPHARAENQNQSREYRSHPAKTRSYLELKAQNEEMQKKLAERDAHVTALTNQKAESENRIQKLTAQLKEAKTLNESYEKEQRTVENQFIDLIFRLVDAQKTILTLKQQLSMPDHCYLKITQQASLPVNPAIEARLRSIWEEA